MDKPHPNFIDNGFSRIGFAKNPIVGERFNIISQGGKIIFSSSPVTEITENGFKTRNSIYKIEVLS